MKVEKQEEAKIMKVKKPEENYSMKVKKQEEAKKMKVEKQLSRAQALKLEKLSMKLLPQNKIDLQAKEGLHFQQYRPKFYTAHTMVLGPVRSQSEEQLRLLKLQAGQRVTDHLRFKQAQPKMCHSPKVEDVVEN